MTPRLPTRRPRGQSTSAKAFLSAAMAAARIHAGMRKYCVYEADSITDTEFHPTTAAKVIGLSFLSIVAAWEEYVEASFLRYMTGTPTSSAYLPRLRLGRSPNLVHARQVLGGSLVPQEQDRRLRWNDFGWVVSTARIYLHRAEPFSNVSSRFMERLSDAQILRNRVAHSSWRARDQFRKTSNRLIGVPATEPLEPGFSPGRLLVSHAAECMFDKAWLDSKNHWWGDVFEAYASMYVELVDVITPGEIEAIGRAALEREARPGDA